MAGRGKKDPGYNRAGMFVILVAAMVVLGVLWYQTRQLENSIAVYQAAYDALVLRIQEENTRTGEIEKLRDYMQTEEYAESYAREKLGFVKPGETVFEEAR